MHFASSPGEKCGLDYSDETGGLPLHPPRAPAFNERLDLIR